MSVGMVLGGCGAPWCGSANLTPFLFRPMHTCLIKCWQARVRSVYGNVLAAAAVLLVRSSLNPSTVSLVRVGSVAVLPDVVCVAGSFLSALISRALVRPFAV